MQITATSRAVEVVERAKASRSGHLSITLGGGCCDSTAPFLYEDHYAGPDAEVVGQVAGVEVFAPERLRRLYPDDETLEVDVIDGPAESFSIETEWDCRLQLR